MVSFVAGLNRVFDFVSSRPEQGFERPKHGFSLKSFDFFSITLRTQAMEPFYSVHIPCLHLEVIESPLSIISQVNSVIAQLGNE